MIRVSEAAGCVETNYSLKCIPCFHRFQSPYTELCLDKVSVSNDCRCRVLSVADRIINQLRSKLEVTFIPGMQRIVTQDNSKGHRFRPRIDQSLKPLRHRWVAEKDVHQQRGCQPVCFASCPDKRVDILMKLCSRLVIKPAFSISPGKNIQPYALLLR